MIIPNVVGIVVVGIVVVDIVKFVIVGLLILVYLINPASHINKIELLYIPMLFGLERPVIKATTFPFVSIFNILFRAVLHTYIFPIESTHILLDIKLFKYAYFSSWFNPIALVLYVFSLLFAIIDSGA